MSNLGKPPATLLPVTLWARPIRLLTLIALVLISGAGLAQPQIYKCEVDGKIVYTDKVCASGSSRELDIKPLNAMSAAKVESKSVRPGSPAPAYESNRWYTDNAGYQEALRVSKARGAPLFIYAYTDWCRYCQAFEAALLPKAKVKQALSGYVKVRINPEHSAGDLALFNKWGGRGYPSLLVQAGPGAVPINRGSPFEQGKLLSETDFSRRFTQSITAVSTPIGQR